MFSVKYVVGHHGLVQTFIARVWIISLFGGKNALIDKVVGLKILQTCAFIAVSCNNTIKNRTTKKCALLLFSRFTFIISAVTSTVPKSLNLVTFRDKF